MPEKVKHGPYRVQLNLTFQGDIYHAESWFIEDEDDIPVMKRETWSIEVKRVNL